MGTVNTVSFPGLGIYNLEINRVAFSFSIGDNEISIYWYAIIITFGMILAMLFAMWKAKDFGLTSDNMVDVALWGVPAALIGARIYYVLFRLDKFETMWEMINFRNGGLAIYGGVIAGFLTALIYCKKKKIPVFAMFDLGALGFFIGQIIGRWGNFVNCEAFGGKTNLPWRMLIQYASGTVITGVHPTFIYESLWNLIGLILAWFVVRKIQKADGEIFFFYTAWYGLGRAFIEGLRADSLYLFGVIRISQLLGAVLCVAAIVCLVLIRMGKWTKLVSDFQARREAKRGVYSPVYDKEKKEAAMLDETTVNDSDLFVASLEAHRNMKTDEDYKDTKNSFLRGDK